MPLENIRFVPPDLKEIKGKPMPIQPAEVFVGPKNINMASVFWDEPHLAAKGLNGVVVNWADAATTVDRESIRQILANITGTPLKEILDAPWPS